MLGKSGCDSTWRLAGFILAQSKTSCICKCFQLLANNEETWFAYRTFALRPTESYSLITVVIGSYYIIYTIYVYLIDIEVREADVSAFS